MTSVTLWKILLLSTPTFSSTQQILLLQEEQNVIDSFDDITLSEVRSVLESEDNTTSISSNV